MFGILTRRPENEAVRDLVDVGVGLLQMHTVRTGIGNIGEEPAGQLTLDVEVILLKISVLLHGVAGIGEVVLRQGILRNIGLWVAACYGCNHIRTRAGHRLPCCPILALIKWSCAGTHECATAERGLSTSILVERGSGGDSV